MGYPEGRARRAGFFCGLHAQRRPLVGRHIQVALTRLLTDREVAAVLAVQPDTVRRWAACGALPSVRLGNRLLRFRAEEVERWIEEHATGAHATMSLRRRPGSIRSTR